MTSIRLDDDDHKDKTVELKYHFDYRELKEDLAFATENKANYNRI